MSTQREIKTGDYTRTQSFVPQTTQNRPIFFTESIEGAPLNGMPTFQEVEFVKIIMPGNAGLTVPVKRVTNEHKQLWPNEYAAFKAGIEPSANGFPIEQWPILNKSMVKELKYMELHTVEQIASMPDTACQRFMAGYQLRDMAKSYLDDNEKVALEKRLSQENQDLRGELSLVQGQFKDLSDRTTALYNELMMLKNAPSQIATTIPGMQDPMEANKPYSAEPPVPQSALSALAARTKKK